MDGIKLKDDISFRNRLIRPRYNKHFIFIHHVERVKCCFELFFIFLDYERKKSVGSAFLKKIVRVGRVTGNTELFFLAQLRRKSIIINIGVGQQDGFSQIISARVLKVANGPTEHISAISFVKYEKSAQDPALLCQYRI